MAINQIIINEFKQELVGTKKMIASLSDAVLEFKPHEKSTSLKKLAIHVADIYNWYDLTINQNELDFAKGDYKSPNCENAADIVAYLEKTSNDALKVLMNGTDEQLKESWTMRNGDQVYFTLPKSEVLRTWCMNHLYHHRAQLGMYLRLNNIAVPGMYGPTADDHTM